jgi:hypothetical protein
LRRKGNARHTTYFFLLLVIKFLAGNDEYQRIVKLLFLLGMSLIGPYKRAERLSDACRKLWR